LVDAKRGRPRAILHESAVTSGEHFALREGVFVPSGCCDASGPFQKVQIRDCAEHTSEDLT